MGVASEATLSFAVCNADLKMVFLSNSALDQTFIPNADPFVDLGYSTYYFQIFKSYSMNFAF
jgi:hypothetical protein